MWFRPLGVVGPGNGFSRRGGGSPAFVPDNGTAYIVGALGDSLKMSFTDGTIFDLFSVDLAEYSTVVPNASRLQDEVTLTETLGLNRANPDYYALNLGNQVLGGAFYASRLSRDLRENSGLVYTVSSSLNVGRTRGFYSIAYGCDPENVSKARATVEKDLKGLQESQVPADVLRQAKVLLLQQIPLSQSSVSAIARGLLARTDNDLPLDEPTQAANRYAAMTAQQVQAAFAKWIRPGDLVQITEGPNPK